MTDDGLYTEGDVVEFRCYYGYQMWGEDRITCQASGNWSGALAFTQSPPLPSFPPFHACLGNNKQIFQFIFLWLIRVIFGL